MHWIWLLLLAVSFEVGGTTCMKLSNGFSRPVPSALLFIFYGLAFLTLTFLVRKVEIGVAYAMWAAIGTAAVAIVGIVVFHESASPLKLASLAVIILGVIGLNLATSGH